MARLTARYLELLARGEPLPPELAAIVNPPPPDYSTWTREQLIAEIEDLQRQVESLGAERMEGR